MPFAKLEMDSLWYAYSFALTTLAAFSSSLSLSGGQTRGSSVILVSLRSRAALAAQAALRPLERSLIIIAASRQL